MMAFVVVEERWGREADIVIGCVDSRAARHAITRTQTPAWFQKETI
jgi:hypothetical protein